MKQRTTKRRFLRPPEHSFLPRKPFNSRFLFTFIRENYRIPTLVFLSVLCFITSIHGNFVFDDSQAIVENEVVTRTERFLDVFTTDYWGRPIRSSKSHKSYRPVTTLTFMLNHLIFGLSTTSYHLVNVLLHAINTIIVFKTNLKIMNLLGEKSEHSAFVASLIFAVHPVHTEAVANVVGRAELLMTIFVFVTINIYLENINKPTVSMRRRCAILLTSLLALFSKEQGIIALPVCAVLDMLVMRISPKELLTLYNEKVSDTRNNNRTNSRTDILLKIRYVPRFARFAQMIGCTTFLVLFRLFINGFHSPEFSAFDNPAAFHPSPFFRAVNYGYLFLLNVWLLTNPSKLCFDYSMGCISLIESFSDIRLLIIALSALAVFFFAYLLYKRAIQITRTEAFAILFFLLSYLPASNILVTVGFVLAERVLYLPSFGYCLFCSILYARADKALDRSKRDLLRSGVSILIILAISKSLARSSEWKTELDIYKSGLLVCPNNAKIHYNLGKVLADSGDIVTAEINYNNALRLNPWYDHAMNNLANIYLLNKRYTDAESLLRKCVQLRPNFAAAWMNLGLSLLAQNKFEDAKKSFMNALYIRPRYPDCIYNLGNLYLQQDQKLLAEQMWRNATAMQPDHERAWVNLLVLLDEMGECSEVIRLSTKALHYLYNKASVHFQLGTCYAKTGRFKEAEEHLKAAVNLESVNALYWTNLGILYQRWGRPKMAIAAYKNVLKLQPSSSTANENIDKLRKRNSSEEPSPTF